MRKYLAAALGMLFTLGLYPPARGGNQITIGGVEVPAECALARHERPYLLFNKADLPGLRARLKHPRIAAGLEHAKRLAAAGKAGPILRGVLYYLTEQQEYIHQAKATLIRVDDRLLILKTDGSLVLASANSNKYEEPARTQVLENTARALPALAGGLLYVRDTGVLKCVDLRPNKP